MRIIITIAAILVTATNYGQSYNELKSQFEAEVGSNNCPQYLDRIQHLINSVNESLEGLSISEPNYKPLMGLRKKAEAFKDFVSTLSGCGGSGDQVSLKYFNQFINELNLGPILLSKNECGELYKLVIGNFSTFYVINSGTGKTYSISIKGETGSSVITLGTLCKVARGFSQGEKFGKIQRIGFTCKPITEDCWEP